MERQCISAFFLLKKRNLYSLSRELRIFFSKYVLFHRAYIYICSPSLYCVVVVESIKIESIIQLFDI